MRLHRRRKADVELNPYRSVVPLLVAGLLLLLAPGIVNIWQTSRVNDRADKAVAALASQARTIEALRLRIDTLEAAADTRAAANLSAAFIELRTQLQTQLDAILAGLEDVRRNRTVTRRQLPPVTSPPAPQRPPLPSPNPTTPPGTVRAGPTTVPPGRSTPQPVSCPLGLRVGQLCLLPGLG